MGIWKDFWSARSARYKAEALREQVNIERRQRAIALTRKEQKSASDVAELALLESSDPIWGGWDRVNWLSRDLDRYDFARGGPGFPLGTPSQRKDGTNWPFCQNETEHGIYILASRIAFDSITKAEGLIRGMSSYVVGDGVTVRVLAKPGGTPEQAKQAQQVIDDFRSENEMEEREEDFVVKSRRDGEAIWRIFDLGDGTAEIREVWPEQIRQPSGSTFEEWGFGIQCDSADMEKPVAFAVHDTTGDVNEVEVVSAEDIIFFKINVDRAVKRGMPDLSWGFLDAIKASDKLSKNMGEGSAVQASIAFIRQHTGAPKSTIQAFADADASYKKPDPYTGIDKKVRVFDSATVIDTNENTEFLGSPYNAGISSHIEVVKLVDRVACVKYNAPEWLGNADASSNSFANALAQESPFVLRMKSFQRRYGRPFRRLHERVLEIAASAGKLPSNILDIVEVKVTFPNPQARDQREESERSEIDLRIGTTSPQIVAEEAGRDWDKIVKQRKEAIAEGWTPPTGGGGLPGQPGQNGKPVGGIGGANGSPGMAILNGMNGRPATESKKKGIFEGDWDESKHPRAANGEFGKGGGEKASTKVSDEKKSAPKGWGQVDDDPTDYHEPAEDMSSEQINEAANRKPLKAPADQEVAENIKEAWDDVSRLWPEMAAKVTRITEFDPNQTPVGVNAFVNPQTGLLAVRPGAKLGHESLWHELVHLDQQHRGILKGRMEMDADEYNEVEREAVIRARKAMKAVAALRSTNGRPAMESNRNGHGYELFEAWDESDHPRDDDGKFVDANEMVAARSDSGKAEELRKKVTNPEELKKLDAVLNVKAKQSTKKKTEPNAKEVASLKQMMDAGAEDESNEHIQKAKAYMETIKGTPKDQLRAIATAAGIEGLFASTSKDELMNRIYNRITVRHRARDRAEV